MIVKTAVFIGMAAVFAYQLGGYLWNDLDEVLGRCDEEETYLNCRSGIN